VPEYHVRSFMLDQLIKEHLPDLSLYFKRLGLNPEVVTGQWLMTFFCGYFNYPNILAILDNFFLDDWLAVFRISLALLKQFKSELMLNSDIAYVAQFFHSLKDKTEHLDLRLLLSDSLQFGLSEESLNYYEQQYFISRAQEKLTPTSSDSKPTPAE
jgi:Rab-GTPase-TBC domain